MSLDELKRAILGWAFAIFALCYAIRVGFELILPVLPFVMCLGFVAVIVAAGIWYYRWRYWDGY